MEMLLETLEMIKNTAEKIVDSTDMWENVTDTHILPPEMLKELPETF